MGTFYYQTDASGNSGTSIGMTCYTKCWYSVHMVCTANMGAEVASGEKKIAVVMEIVNETTQQSVTKEFDLKMADADTLPGLLFFRSYGDSRFDTYVDYIRFHNDAAVASAAWDHVEDYAQLQDFQHMVADSNGKYTGIAPFGFTSSVGTADNLTLKTEAEGTNQWLHSAGSKMTFTPWAGRKLLTGKTMDISFDVAMDSSTNGGLLSFVTPNTKNEVRILHLAAGGALWFGMNNGGFSKIGTVATDGTFTNVRVVMTPTKWNEFLYQIYIGEELAAYTEFVPGATEGSYTCNFYTQVKNTSYDSTVKVGDVTWYVKNNVTGNTGGTWGSDTNNAPRTPFDCWADDTTGTVNTNEGTPCITAFYMCHSNSCVNLQLDNLKIISAVPAVEDGILDVAQMVGVQNSQTGDKVRLVLGVDGLDADRIGADIQMYDATAKELKTVVSEANTNTVYTSIQVGESETVKASDYNVTYMALLVITDIDSTAAGTIRIRPYTVHRGVRTYGEGVDLTIDGDTAEVDTTGNKLVATNLTTVFVQDFNDGAVSNTDYKWGGQGTPQTGTAIDQSEGDKALQITTAPFVGSNSANKVIYTGELAKGDTVTVGTGEEERQLTIAEETSNSVTYKYLQYEGKSALSDTTFGTRAKIKNAIPRDLAPYLGLGYKMTITATVKVVEGEILVNKTDDYAELLGSGVITAAKVYERRTLATGENVTLTWTLFTIDGYSPVSGAPKVNAVSTFAVGEERVIEFEVDVDAVYNNGAEMVPTLLLGDNGQSTTGYSYKTILDDVTVTFVKD